MTKRAWIVLAIVGLIAIGAPTASWLQRRGSGSLRVVVKNQTSSSISGLSVASEGAASSALADLAPGDSSSVTPALASGPADVVLTDSEGRHYTLLFEYEDYNDGSSVTAVVERVGNGGLSGQLIDGTPYAAEDRSLSPDAQ